MKKIDKLNPQINKLFNAIEKIVLSAPFSRKQEFIASKKIDQSKFNKYNTPGIYLIEIKVENPAMDINKWKNNIINKWDPEFHNEHSPSTKKIRLNKHVQLKKWMPFYLGKSEKISKRMKEHIEKKKEAKTFALKFQARKQIYGMTFRISFIPLPKENYAILGSFIENILRQKYNPIVGKQ